ncbi:MAG: glycosyltransferase [Bacteroidota bacterium]|nr:glycosyltransferase family 2 protein [Candidatus Kapabacteria bacterium]MDW8219957.1 glycosyltransferase [Bacteroidota bacterium]
MQFAAVRVAIVIVNYNVKDLLASCLASLRASLGRCAAQGVVADIIVVDNDSTDGSVEYLTPTFPEVQFIRLAENVGFGKANNIGFCKALQNGAQYILCLNPDTLISEDTIDSMVQFMQAHPEVGIAGCKLLNADGTFQLACRRGFPTPWASFCKVFGLQALFPQSRLFAQYNQTFRSEDDTYAVDAVGGAFMFIRREALEAVKGFDEDFFMYGEDLDLCYRVQQQGWKIMYVHTTSVIHYKGESTRRSAINEIKHFYEAMEIFARKHYGSSWLFLALLRAGIAVRSALAYLSAYRWEFGFAVADVVIMNGALLLGTFLWKGRIWGFPSYAYPTVFIALSVVTLLSMIAAGEYSPYAKPAVRRAWSGLMISFFILSALTYFFKDYAFSRGVLLLTIGIGMIGTAVVRVTVGFIEKIVGQERERRIAFIGNNAATVHLAEQLAVPHAASVGKRSRARVVGIITTALAKSDDMPEQLPVPIIGHISYLRKIIEQYRIDEVIVTDTVMPRADILQYIMEAAQSSGARSSCRATFRFAREYDDVVAGRIVEKYVGNITGSFADSAPQGIQYNLALWKYRLVKRIIDIVGAVFILTIGLPVVILRKPPHMRRRVRQVFDVLCGAKSLIGLYLPLDIAPTIVQSTYTTTHRLLQLGKIGLTGLAHVHNPEQLSPHAIESLNEFYVRYYSLWLDVDILVTLFFRIERHE